MADATVDGASTNSEELVNTGIRAYLLRDYNGAVTALSRATELMTVEHGEKHDSLGRVYLYYGKALLEVSREEAEPLGDVVGREFNTDSDDEDGIVENVVNEATEEAVNGSAVNADSSEPTQSNGSAENGEVTGNEDVKDPEEPSSSGIPPQNEKPPEEGESTEEKQEEEPTDLQVAWEILELAKLIFETRGEDGHQELADTLITLGEVSMESENFENAVADIKKGLAIQKEFLGSDSRTLAETYYKLAVALSTDNQIDEAVENFNTSLGVLQQRINVLKENEEKNKSEITEIQGLIPEIQEKINDMRSYKEEATNKLVAAFANSEAGSALKADGSMSSAQVNDISHLVKRKRKLDDISETVEESPSKKQPSA